MTGYPSATPDVLAAIVAATRRTVADRQRVVAMGELARRARSGSPRGDLFTGRVGRRDAVNIIAECKRRSPSKGVLCRDYDPVNIARAYEAAGAAAISVLTEPSFFDGSLTHLAAVRQSVDVPLLRKDFVVDEYQLHEARLAGADAVLLIVAALEDDRLQRLIDKASDLGLASVVEVHDEVECHRAVAAGAVIVGVNNRDLRTLQTDTTVSARIVSSLPESVIAVAESGLRSGADVRAARRAGFHACLIGESLIAGDDPGGRLRQFLADAAA